MTMTPIYPAYCIPCLAKRECQSLPHSNNCEALRRVENVEPKQETKPKGDNDGRA